MSNFLSFLKLIRFKNLLIIALTQLLIKYSLINIYLEYYALNDLEFLVYLTSLILIVASGYIINDIYDLETDKINKKDKIIIGDKISVNSAFRIYYILNLLGILSGFIIAYFIEKLAFGFIFVFFAISFWRYSKQNKTKLLVGNLQIAFLTALSIINLILFDLLPVSTANKDNSLMIIKIILFYAFFAFIITLIREIIKDTEDVEGDKKINANTIAIKFGTQKAKKITISLSMIPIVGIAYFQYFHFRDFSVDLLIEAIYTLSIQFLFILLIIKIRSSEKKEDFHFSSVLSKIIMLFGILSIPLFTFLEQN